MRGRSGLAYPPVQAGESLYTFANLSALRVRGSSGRRVLADLDEQYEKGGAALRNLRMLVCEPWPPGNRKLSDLLQYGSPNLSHLAIKFFSDDLDDNVSQLEQMLQPIATRLTCLKIRTVDGTQHVEPKSGSHARLKALLDALPHLRSFGIVTVHQLPDIVDILPADLQHLSMEGSSATLRAVLAALAD